MKHNGYCGGGTQWLSYYYGKCIYQRVFFVIVNDGER